MRKITSTTLSVLLSCCMIISSALPTLAAETSTQEKLDTALEELLETAKTCGSNEYSEEEKEAFDLLSSEDSAMPATYCLPTIEYTASDESYYVSLGDSTVTGMHLEGYGNYGYKTKVPGSYPYKIAKKLNLDIDTQYEQLACGGLRAEDIRFILDETFVGDGYTDSKVLDTLNTYAGGLDTTRETFDEHLAKADFVTVGMGGNSFGTFMNTQLNRHKAGQELIEIDWNRYLDSTTASTIETLLSSLHNLLIEAGLNEADAYVAMIYVKSLLYGYVGFAANFGATLNEIHEHSPNSKLIIVGLYNIAKGVYLDVEGIRLDIGAFMEQLIDFANAHFEVYASITDNTVYVDVINTETFKDVEIAQNNIDLSLFNYLEYITSDDSKDDHPTDAGHTDIANRVLASLNYTPVPEQPEVEIPEADSSASETPDIDASENESFGTETPGANIPESGTPDPDISENETPNIENQEPTTENNEPEISTTEDSEINKPNTTKPSKLHFGLFSNLFSKISSVFSGFTFNFKLPVFSWFHK